jgi:hypothetical protein
LLSAIQKAANDRDIKLRILVCGTPQPITHNSNYFDTDLGKSLQNLRFSQYLAVYIDLLSEETNFREWLENSRNDKVLEDWVRSCMARLAPGILVEFAECVDFCVAVCEGGQTFIKGKDIEFKMLLLFRERWFERCLESIEGVKVLHQPDKDEAVFFWLQDQETEAVFVFADSGTQTRGLGFRTRDAGLLRIFESIFQDRWARNSKPQKPIQGGWKATTHSLWTKAANWLKGFF